MSAAPCDPSDEAELIARITRLEAQKATIAAEQAEAILLFARVHVESQIAAGVVEPEALERSVASQVGMACRVSASEGRRRVQVARDLHDGHERVRELFAAGELSEYQTSTIVSATTHLSSEERARVDAELASRRVERLGVRRISTLARSLAAKVAPEKFLARARAARSGRRVSVRPAADGMADLIAHLPAQEAVACYAALVAAVNEVAISPEPVTRGRGQIMADTLVERLTGQANARDVDLEIQVVVPVEALVDPGSSLPAEIPGHGPVPVELLLTGDGRRSWRRLVTRDGVVIGGDSRKRFFTGVLAELIQARDGGRCREPYCDAPIRHIDHVRRWTEDGRTEFDNGRGLCAFHNQVRETPGWRAEVTDHGIVTTTPTGHSYLSAPGATVAGIRNFPPSASPDGAPRPAGRTRARRRRRGRRRVREPQRA